jgi:hypothetical protein
MRFFLASAKASNLGEEQFNVILDGTIPLFDDVVRVVVSLYEGRLRKPVSKKLLLPSTYAGQEPGSRKVGQSTEATQKPCNRVCRNQVIYFGYRVRSGIYPVPMPRQSTVHLGIPP